MIETQFKMKHQKLKKEGSVDSPHTKSLKDTAFIKNREVIYERSIAIQLQRLFTSLQNGPDEAKTYVSLFYHLVCSFVLSLKAFSYMSKYLY